LIQEYQLHQHEKNKSLSNQEIIEQAARLLEARDRFIAKRIDETLQAEETGLLFLGAAHRLDTLKSTDIRVEILMS
jgi:pheromone shutdown protein TraB